jgi:hypothetical protein
VKEREKEIGEKLEGRKLDRGVSADTWTSNGSGFQLVPDKIWVWEYYLGKEGMNGNPMLAI